MYTSAYARSTVYGHGQSEGGAFTIRVRRRNTGPVYGGIRVRCRPLGEAGMVTSGLLEALNDGSIRLFEAPRASSGHHIHRQLCDSLRPSIFHCKLFFTASNMLRTDLEANRITIQEHLRLFKMLFRYKTRRTIPLPVELLSEIFALCIPPPNVVCEHYDFSIDPHLIRSNLRLVCRTWNDVILFTPQVWSTIYLHHCIPVSITQVERLLSLSCHLPLTVVLSPLSQNDWPDSYWMVLIALILENHLRLQTFATLRWDEFIYRTLPDHANLECPLLETFACGSNDSLLQAKVCPMIAPKLSTLRLFRVDGLGSFSNDTFMHLKHLQVNGGYGGSVCIRILRCCRLLEELSWRSTNNIPIPQILLPIPLERLRKVSILFGDDDISRDILGCIVAPDLEEIKSPPSPQDHLWLTKLLSTDITGCNLRSLSITETPLSASFVTLLSAHPNMSTLFIQSCTQLDEFLKELTNTEQRVFCPALSILQLESCAFDLKVFFAFWASRGPKSRNPIATIKVMTPSMTNEHKEALLHHMKYADSKLAQVLKFIRSCGCVFVTVYIATIVVISVLDIPARGIVIMIMTFCALGFIALSALILGGLAVIRRMTSS
ncbi:hypothetical protein M422DRAFT_250489 [Sphaerobolus stellatus SS14]|uniref:F-box domain-containing protein n=1 Tax=Sphaerobolus stellatus (strain SS14) TaxID=990650 RepID=A0A0C9VGB2_SPHS4|nr:hypothetical protein M422DRAFT_250489 [Sphaerobolus stellatus SS14]